MRILGRIIIRIVDTVYDTTKIIGPCPKKSVKFLTVKLSLDLLCISLTNSSNSICINNSALKEVGILIKTKLIRRKEIIRKSCYLLNLLNKFINI